MGFEKSIPVSGQTYTRKIDAKVLAVLSGIAQSAHKMTNDIRLLQHLKEVESLLKKSRSVLLLWRIREIRCEVRESLSVPVCHEQFHVSRNDGVHSVV